jgi:DNA-binding MarR family transcriptional regulator
MSDDLRRGGFLLSKIHHLSGRIFARKLKRHGLDALNPAQGRILFVLWGRSELAMQDLARLTGLGNSTLTTMLDRLEQQGYVERLPTPGDRRSVRVRHTAKDESFRRAFLAVSEEMTELWYRGVSEHDREIFESILLRIWTNLGDGETTQ